MNACLHTRATLHAHMLDASKHTCKHLATTQHELYVLLSEVPLPGHARQTCRVLHHSILTSCTCLQTAPHSPHVWHAPSNAAQLHCTGVTVLLPANTSLMLCMYSMQYSHLAFTVQYWSCLAGVHNRHRSAQCICPRRIMMRAPLKPIDMLCELHSKVVCSCQTCATNILLSCGTGVAPQDITCSHT